MAILNRIVNILILVLVIAAGVFSYMLFDKRESLTGGMKEMAKAVAQTAGTLDDGGASGTKAANTLKVSELDHKKDFKSLLPTLNKTAGEIVAQRNDLAKTIVQAGKSLSVDVKVDSLKLVDNSKNEVGKFLTGVENYKRNTEGVKSAFVKIGEKVGAGVKKSDLSGEGYNLASDKIMAKVDVINKESRITKTDIAYAKRVLGVAGNNYSTNTSKFWKEAVDKRAKQIRDITAERNKFKNLSGKQEKEIAKLKEEKANLEAELKKTGKELANRIKIITDDGKKPEPALKLQSDSPECYHYVKGSVEYVNREYGFVQIDIGKDYTIEQEYGVMKNIVRFPLQAGLTMTVTRGSGENAEVVGTIFVKTVNENNAICNVIKGSVSDIREKDTVFFSPADIARIPAAVKRK